MCATSSKRLLEKSVERLLHILHNGIDKLARCFSARRQPSCKSSRHAWSLKAVSVGPGHQTCYDRGRDS